MQTLDTLIKIHICGTTEQRARTIKLLSRITLAGNISHTHGFWHEYSEPTTILSVWLDSDSDNEKLVNRLVRALRTYQHYASQEAVFVEVISKQNTFAWVIEPSDWAEVTETLQWVANHTEQLLRYFGA